MTNQLPATADPDSMESGDVCTSTAPNNKLRCQGYSLSTSLVAISYIQNIRKTGFLYSLKQFGFVLHRMVLQESRRGPTGPLHNFTWPTDVA
jgi:hypothetical protein